MSGAFQSQKFWGQAQFSLQEVKRLLSDSFGLGQFAFDYENVFEWFEAQGAEGSHWNVSRKHDGDGQPSFDEYLIIAISPVPKNTVELGQKISNALSCTVSFGEGAYDKNDSWKFVERQKFVPGPSRSQTATFIDKLSDGLRCDKCGGTVFDGIVSGLSFSFRCCSCHSPGPATSWSAVGPKWEGTIKVYRDEGVIDAPVLEGEGKEIWQEIRQLSLGGKRLLLR